MVRLPDITFEGNTSTIAQSIITFRDNGDGTSTANIYLSGTEAETYEKWGYGVVAKDAETFSVAIDEGDFEAAISDGIVILNEGTRLQTEYHKPYHWGNSIGITSDTTITIS